MDVSAVTLDCSVHVLVSPDPKHDKKKRLLLGPTFVWRPYVAFGRVYFVHISDLLSTQFSSSRPHARKLFSTTVRICSANVGHAASGPHVQGHRYWSSKITAQYMVPSQSVPLYNHAHSAPLGVSTQSELLCTHAQSRPLGQQVHSDINSGRRSDLLSARFFRSGPTFGGWCSRFFAPVSRARICFIGRPADRLSLLCPYLTLRVKVIGRSANLPSSPVVLRMPHV